MGLDLHKYYLVAVAVDEDLNKVYGPRRVELAEVEAWAAKTLTPDDAVVLEMTANAWTLHDELRPRVHSVTVVHPPHVALIVRAQVMTDKLAALQLARLHAKGLLTAIWVPPQDVRDLRALVIQREKMVRFKTQAKCRLHATLHRYHLLPPRADRVFAEETRAWWKALPVTALEHVRIASDLATLAFAEEQIADLEKRMADWAAHEPRVARLFQITGLGLVCAVTLLAAIGDIHRFPTPDHLVGYSGLGARVHDSGLTTRTGGITKAGRKELRAALVEAANTAVIHDPYWKAELQRLAPRTGRNKAIVAIARKMLELSWHLLNKETVDRRLDVERLARKYLEFAYTMSKEARGMTATEYVRAKLDLVGVGRALGSFRQGQRRIALPPSKLTASV